jgi:hypothetical protein
MIPLKQCYAPPMTFAVGRKFTAWIFDHLLWDTTGAPERGFWGGLWATRKLFIALFGAALLTWREWVEHHPPEIAIVAVIHFVFVFAAVALLVFAGRRLRRNGAKSAG